MDGDGIPQRTLPGVHPKGAYFTRGSGHNKYGAYTEDADEYQEVIDRIARKVQNAAKAVPAPFVRKRRRRRDDGPRHDRRLPRRRAWRRSTCWPKDGIALDYMRVRGFPFGDDVRAFLEQHDVTFVVEQNRDAQLRSLLMLETGVARREARVGALLRRLPAERASRGLRA